MKNTQEWLESQEEYNTLEKRGEKTDLDISNQNLQGSLSLKEFIKLEKLDCSKNQLTSLDLSGCRELVFLNCSENRYLIGLNLENCISLKTLLCQGNLLSNLDFINQVNKNILTHLDISDNNFANGELVCFRYYDKLETLKINADNINREQGEICRQLYNYLKNYGDNNVVEMNEWRKEHLKLGKKIQDKRSKEQKELARSLLSSSLNYLKQGIREAVSSPSANRKLKEWTENISNLVSLNYNNFSGDFSSFTGGVGSRNTGPQEINIPQMENEQQAQIIQQNYLNHSN